jgi:hypothetical protein
MPVWRPAEKVRAASERKERARGKEKAPRLFRIARLWINPRQRPTLPRTYARSTIGGSRLNFRVRNGNGCDPAPMTTGKLLANLEDRTLRCPGDFPGACSFNAPNSATWRLGVRLRCPSRRRSYVADKGACRAEARRAKAGRPRTCRSEYSAMRSFFDHTPTEWKGSEMVKPHG